MPEQTPLERLAAVRNEIDEISEYDGCCLVKLYTGLSVYYKGTFKENAEALLAFYNHSIEQIGSHVKFYHIDGKNQPKKIRRDTLGLLPFWTSEEGEERAMYDLSLKSGPEKYDVSDRAFHLWQWLYHGYVRLLLPAEFVLTSTEAFVQLAKAAVLKLKFWSGVGGFALNFEPDYPSDLSNRRVGTVSARFLNVDVEPMSALAPTADKGIKDVGWLTLVGDDFLSRAGGRSEIQKRLAAIDGVIVHKLQHGIMIQIGEQPVLGDMTQGEDLSWYYAVGEVLKPLKNPKADFAVGDRIGGVQRTEEWLYRFFK